MFIESIDFFYLSMPVVRDIGDGSQDALLVRLRAGDHEGWGECEASPLVSIASLVCPPSHSACKPVSASVLGQRLDSVADIARIGRDVRANSADLLQADHTLSGIDMAMWDLLGRRFEVPVYQLLGVTAPHPKTPYASQLFGNEPEQTYQRARKVRESGFRAAKFGWGPYGRGSVAADEDQLVAARDGLGADAVLLVDAGTVWGDDVEAAALRLPALQTQRVRFLEEPFITGAHAAYRRLRAQSGDVRIAGGEGSHDFYTALHMLDHADLDYIQIDTGRVGGITTACQVAEAAAARGVTYLNHTFTSHLALSASLQPFLGIEAATLCEYPVAAQPLAVDLTSDHLTVDADGQLRMPERPGLGVDVNPAGMAQYLQQVEIRVNGDLLYDTPSLPQPAVAVEPH